MTNLRDNRTTVADLRRQLEEFDDELAQAHRQLSRAIQYDGPAWPAYAGRLRSWAISEAIAMYSVGEPMDDIAAKVRGVGAVWADIDELLGERAHDAQWLQAMAKGNLNDRTQYSFTVKALAWAISLNDTETVRSILDSSMVRSSPSDLLIARLAAWAGFDYDASTLLYPKQWQPVLDVADTDPDQRPAALADYLRQWPKIWRRLGWLEKPDSGFYIGQWCFDAAALAICLDIDDTAARTSPDYPADLVDYGRSLR